MTLPEPVAHDLIELRQEEKLARDVYLTLLQRYPLQIFANIAGSEQRHFDRVGMLMERFGLQDPITDDTVGAFPEGRWADLYRELVDRGLTSEVAALEVGLDIEDLDIADLDGMLARTDVDAVVQVYELLRCGSRNHLRAFTRWLAAHGVATRPTHLTAARHEAIIAQGHERCGRLYGGRSGGTCHHG